MSKLKYPNYGKEFEHSFRGLGDERKTCPGCRRSIKLDKSAVRKEVDKAVKELGRGLKNIKIRL